MKKIILFLTLALIAESLSAQSPLAAKAKSIVGAGKPSSGEIASALKEALEQGASKASAQLSVTNGFYKDPSVFIPFPPEAKQVKEKLVKIGLEKKVTEFEMSLNRAAEDAAKEAKPIFIQVIKDFIITKADSILLSNGTAATSALRNAAKGPLAAKMKPVITASAAKVNVQAYWIPLLSTYNKLPGVTKVDLDLERYLTDKLIDGFLSKIGEEELNIRSNIGARTPSLQKVFGYADKKP